MNGKWLFTGDKRPLAIICRTGDDECMFDMDGRRIDADEFEALMSVQEV